MGSKERQDRERQAVRQSILDAARDLFTIEGYRNVSIRKIAERIEYSPAAIYSYFKSQDDIFYALAEEGFRLLEGSLEKVLALEAENPLDAVRTGFLEYYQFSKAHPQYFELMFVDRTVPSIEQEWDRFGFVHEMLRRAALLISRCIDAGLMPARTDPRVAFHIVFAAVDVVAVLGLCKRIAPDEDPDLLVRDVIEAALAGLRVGIGTSFTASALTHPPLSAAAPSPGDPDVQA